MNFYKLNLFACILFMHQKVNAQFLNLKPDSVINYQFIGLISDMSQASYKITYKYFPSGDIQEKNTFEWNSNKQSWNHIFRFKYYSISTNTIEERFNMQHDSIKYLDRTEYRFNKPKQISQITKEKIQNNNPYLLERTEYQYQNDTLKKVEFFINSTTYFKSKEFLFSYKPKLITKQEITFLEKEQKKNSETSIFTKYNFNSPVESIIQFHNPEKINTKQVFTYDDSKKLIADTLKQIKNNKEEVNIITTYTYDNKKNTLSVSSFQTNTNGQLDPKGKNSLQVYYFNQNSPAYSQKFNEYIIE